MNESIESAWLSLLEKKPPPKRCSHGVRIEYYGCWECEQPREDSRFESQSRDTQEAMADADERR